ncbi:hypothetical protein [Denitromonas sp.]|uniref:hypothetical protein n=1 Tax=Denitromonas sp. TaxID=2734609 RepID=UPI002AFF8419|nr:hypothetical protein [Denitromonas sp.]
MTTDTLRQVFGTLRTPNGSPFPNKSLKWFRERRVTVAQGSSVVLDDPFIVTTDAAGEIDTSIMAGAYLVLAPLSDADRYLRVVVPDQAGPFDISSLIDGPTVEPDDLTQFEALVAKAKAWANAPEDTVVESGEYSARHWAEKAQENVDAAVDVALAKAQAWAESPEDAAVEPGKFSALHHRAKAEDAEVGAEAALAGALVAQTGAGAARDAAFINANVYPDIATGRAAVADGQQFQVVSGDEIIRYRRDSSSTQTEVARYPSAAINTLVRFQEFIDRLPKISKVMTFTGDASNGGEYWDGVAEAADAKGGGIFVPSGETGHQSFIRYQFPITADERALYAGRTVKFIVPLVTSSGLMEAIPAWTYGGGGSPSNGTIANRVMTKISDTLALFSFDYTFIGTETLINCFPRINNASTPLAADHHFHGGPLGYFVALDKDGFSDVIGTFLATYRAGADNEMLTDHLPKIPRPLVGNNLTNGVFNGAVLNTPGVLLDGFTIPAGETGFQSFYSAVTNLGHGRAQSLIGKTVRFALELETSENALAQRPFGAGVTAQRVTGTTDPLGAATNTSLVQMTPTRAIVLTDFTFTGVEQNVNLTIQQSSNSAGTGKECSIKPVSMFHVELGADGFEDAVRQSLPTEGVEYIRTVVIKPDGTGDFVSMKAAIDALGSLGQGVGGMGINANRRVKYEVHEGVYTDIEYFMPAFADIVGVGLCENIWFKGELPSSTPLAAATVSSTFWMNETTRIANIKVTCKNMRYPIHSDSSASAKRATQNIFGCIVEHLGNEGLSSGWLPQQAWGCGTHSGQKIISENNKWISGNSRPGFGWHTNKDFTEGNYVENVNDHFVSRDGGVAIGMIENGSKVTHEWVLRGCQIDGILTVTSGGYLTTSPDVDHGNGTIGCRVRASGCSPFAWTSSQDNNVLEVRGTAGASSAVEVSGTAAAVLFGDVPDVIEGGTNYAARVYSQHKINKLAAHSLATRLGDLTGGSLTLTVAVDGAAGVDLTLDQDYSGDSNASIITALNSLASGAGVSVTFYESTPYQNEAPVYQLDREISVQNTSADTVILKGMAVAFDGSRYSGRIATNADARSVIAGIALENIPPGRLGRVQHNGHIAQSQVLFNGTPSLVFGDECGVSATAGQIVEGASVPILRVVGSAVLELVA